MSEVQIQRREQTRYEREIDALLEEQPDRPDFDNDI
jgi:hypothetical protein